MLLLSLLLLLVVVVVVVVEVVAVLLLLPPPLLLLATPLLTSFLLVVSSLVPDPRLDPVLPGLTLLLPRLNELCFRACFGAGEQIATCAHAMPTFA